MYQMATISRFHSTFPSSSCKHMLTGGATKTRTSIYEVSFHLGQAVGNKVFASLIVFSSISVAVFVERVARSRCSL